MPFQSPLGATPPAFPPAGPPIHPTTLPPPGPAQWAPPAAWGPPPVTAGSLVSRTLRIWWQNVGKLLALLLLALVPVALVLGLVVGAAVLSRGEGSSGAPGPLFFAGLALAVLLMVPIFTTLVGGVTFGAIRWLAGQPAGIGDMLRHGSRRVWALFLTGLLVVLATMGGYLALVVPGIMVAVASLVALPAAVVEPIGAVDAMKRSFDLTRGYRWSVFGASAVVGLLSGAGSMLAAVVQLFSPEAGMVLNLTVNVFLSTLGWVLPAVAYHDLRVMKEGVDTSQLSQVFE